MRNLQVNLTFIFTEILKNLTSFLRNICNGRDKRYFLFKNLRKACVFQKQGCNCVEISHATNGNVYSLTL